jgi:hypothetical protein
MILNELDIFGSIGAKLPCDKTNAESCIREDML